MRWRAGAAGALITLCGLTASGCGTAETVTVTQTVTAPRPAPTPTAPARPDGPPPARPARAEFYAPDAPWNTPVARDAPLGSRSAAQVRELTGMVERDGTTVAIREYSIPVYRVPADQPTVRVELDRRAPELQRAFDAVPLPADARPAAGTDGQLLVYQRSTDTIWEFWRLRRDGDRVIAGWGGRMAEVSRSPGYYRRRTEPVVEKPFWGFNATNLGGATGLMTIAELQRGRIDHVLALAIPDARRDVCAAPANSSDGQVDAPDAIPEGTRLWLDPELDVDALDAPRMTKTMARAAQRYGVVVTNRGGAVSFYAEDPVSQSGDPYDEILDGASPGEIARAFPFDRLQVLRGTLRRC